MKRSGKLAIVVTGALALAAGALIASGAPVRPVIIALLNWVRSAGLLGVVVYAAVYVGTAVCFVPPLLLNTAAGFLWGPAAGLAVVLPANVVAAVATFSLGRLLGRDWVARRLWRSRRLTALDHALCTAGLRFVLLMKLSPICPFATLNYVLGTTGLRRRDFLLASLVGTLPGTLLYVSLGSLLGGAAEIFGHHPAQGTGWQAELFAMGLTLMAVAAMVLLRAARKELNRACEPGQG